MCAWLAFTASAAETMQEFIGPFSSWADAKRDDGAVGDGQADDTAALQTALDDLHREGRKFSVLYVPAGTYRVTRTLVLFREKHNESKDVALIGEDPATTTLRWDGPADGVMLDYGACYSKLGRLTFDGQGKARTAIAHGKSFATYSEFFDVFTFTCEPAITAKTNRLAFDDRVVDYDTLKEPLPELPGTPPNRKRPILEVPAGATDDDIQRAVDHAAGLDGQHPVVHLPAGDFRIARTLTLPAKESTPRFWPSARKLAGTARVSIGARPLPEWK